MSGVCNLASAGCLLDTVSPYNKEAWDNDGVAFDPNGDELRRRNLPWKIIASTLACFGINTGATTHPETTATLPNASGADRTVSGIYRFLKTQQRELQTGNPTANRVFDVVVPDGPDTTQQLLPLLIAAVHVQADCLYLREPAGVSQFRYLLGPVAHCALCLLRHVLDANNPNVDRFSTAQLLSLAQWYARQNERVVSAPPP